MLVSNLKQRIHFLISNVSNLKSFRMKISIIFLITIFILTQTVLAQNTGIVEMADALRSSGKIYVVVAVISIVFIGIVVYLFSIDKRVKKVEKGK